MGDFLTDLQQQFYQSFIEGDRWIRYFKGLGISFEVTLGALALGIVLGILVAVVRTAHDQQRDRKSGLLGVFNALCQIYTTVIRGTPMMVQLLIMGFVIFSASRNLVAVAILTLGINSGAYVSEIIRGGIMENQAKILAVAGKGGVGKTSLSASIVRLLTEQYPDKKILAIDADPAVGLSVALGVDVKLTLDDIRMGFSTP